MNPNPKWKCPRCKTWRVEPMGRQCRDCDTAAEAVRRVEAQQELEQAGELELVDAETGQVLR